MDNLPPSLAVQRDLSHPANRDALHKYLSEMLITIADKVFKDRKIYIDGYRFINCSFENCEMFILRGTFEFHHCATFGGIRVFSCEALKTVQLYALGHEQLAFSGDFGATNHPDDSFSITSED